jgi:hypothetical protein
MGLGPYLISPSGLYCDILRHIKVISTSRTAVGTFLQQVSDIELSVTKAEDKRISCNAQHWTYFEII